MTNAFQWTVKLAFSRKYYCGLEQIIWWAFIWMKRSSHRRRYLDKSTKYIWKRVIMNDNSQVIMNNERHVTWRHILHDQQLFWESPSRSDQISNELRLKQKCISIPSDFRALRREEEDELRGEGRPKNRYQLLRYTLF